MQKREEVAPGVLSVVRFERPLENVGRSPLTLPSPREGRGKGLAYVAAAFECFGQRDLVGVFEVAAHG